MLVLLLEEELCRLAAANDLHQGADQINHHFVLDYDDDVDDDDDDDDDDDGRGRSAQASLNSTWLCAFGFCYSAHEIVASITLWINILNHPRWVCGCG